MVTAACYQAAGCATAGRRGPYTLIETKDRPFDSMEVTMKSNLRIRLAVRGQAAALAALALAVLPAGTVEAQVTGLESNILVLEKAAQRGCPTCAPDDPRLLISKASAAIRIDQEAGGDLWIQVIPILAPAMPIARITVDGVEARLEEGRWRVQRAAKTIKKSPRIEITCDNGQELVFKPQHRPHQGPVGGLIMPRKEDQPNAELSVHKKSFWADSLG